MNARRRTFWLVFLGGAAALALIPEYFFPEESSDTPAAHIAKGKRVERGGVSGELPASAPDDGSAPAAVAPRGNGKSPMQSDLFPSQNWRVAPAPMTPEQMAAANAPPPPPPKPMAPPLPFQFIGRLSEAGRTQVFLLNGEQVYTVRPGDVIDNTYRVERITPDELVFTYLPLHQSQSLAVGSAP